MRRNVASQNVGAQLTTVTSGVFFQPSSGLVQTYVARDGGVLNLSAVASGIARPTSYGAHLYTPAQSETDFDHLLFTFVVSGAVPVALNVYTRDASLQTQISSLSTQVGSVDARVMGVGTNVDSLHTRVSSVDARVSATGINVDSLHTRVGSLSALIGTPVGVNLATDVKSIQTMVTSIYDRAGLINTNVDSLHTRVSSVDARVVAAGTNVDSLHTRVSSVDARVSAAGINVDSLHVRVSSLSTLIGVPVGATIATDIKSIQTQVNSIYGRIGEAGINITSASVAVGPVTVTEINSSALARFFNRDSGLYHASAVSGSVVFELAKNVNGPSFGSLQTGVDSLSTKVGSVDARVAAAGTNVDSLHARVSSISALIGVPVGATLSVDVGSIQTQVTSIYARIGAPAGASIAADIAVVEGQTDDIGVAGAGLTVITAKTDNLPSDPADQSLIIDATNAIMSRIGVPIGASLVVDVSSVQVGVNSIMISTGSISTTLSSLHTRVGSAAVEVGSGSVTIASLHTRVGSLSALVGAPVGGTLAVDVGSVQTGVRSLTALIAGGRMTANVDAVNSDANAASNLRRGVLGTVVGGTTGDSTTSVISATGLSPAAAVADQFIGRILTFDRDTLTANLRGQATVVNSMTATGVINVASLTTAPASGNTFVIT